MQRIKKLRWEIGAVLPDEIQSKLSEREKEMFAAYSESLAKFMEDTDIDLTVVGSSIPFSTTNPLNKTGNRGKHNRNRDFCKLGSTAAETVDNVMMAD